MSSLVLPSVRSINALRIGAATTDRVTLVNSTHLQNLTKLSVLSLTYMTTSVDNGSILSKWNFAGNAGWTFASSVASPRLSFRWERATTDLSYVSNTGQYPLNRWMWIAMSMDQGASAGALVRLYTCPYGQMGGFTEVTYATQTDGSGAYGSDAAVVPMIGNYTATNAAYKGSIAMVGLYKDVFGPVDFAGMVASGDLGVTRALGLWLPGAEGTGTVLDRTGRGTTGTITGAIPVPGVPLMAVPSRAKVLALAGGGIPAITGTGTLATSGVTVAATGTETFTGTATLASPGSTVAATGAETFTGTGALTNAGATAAASGTETFTGTATLAQPSSTVGASGTYTPLAITGTGALSTAGATVAATGTETFSGTGTLAAPGSTLAAAGAETFTGTAALANPGSTVAAAGAETLTGTAALTQAGASVAATGTESFTGTGALGTAGATMAGTATETFSGTATLAAPGSTVAASGTSTPLAITGTGTLAATTSLDAVGTMTEAGTAGLAVANFGLAGVGTVTALSISGTGTLATTHGIAATGAETFTATGALGTAGATAAGSGTETFAGSATIAATHGMLATGTETFVGAATLAASGSLLGTGQNQDQVTGDAALAVTGASIHGVGVVGVQTPAGRRVVIVSQPIFTGAHAEDILFATARAGEVSLV